MKRRVWPLVIAALCVTFALGQGDVAWGGDDVPWKEKLPYVQQKAQGDNLLVNGSMEEGFYWKYPNHYIANGWNRWWEGDLMPEYDDGHESGAWDGKHSQRYHVWGSPTTGIYQQVDVEPCLLYQFSMYGRNHSPYHLNHHARVGIDPLGYRYGLYMSELPITTVWSPDQTYYGVWGSHIVTAEARSSLITVIAHISLDDSYDYIDTYWDAGRLIQVPFPDGRLPAPDSWTPWGFIQNLSATSLLDQVIVTWETPEPASTQAWYEITPATGTTQNPPTACVTLADTTPATHHRIVIQGLQSGEAANLVALSRHLVNDVNNHCTTEVSDLRWVYAPLPTDRVPPPDSWTPSGVIQNLTTTAVLDSLVVSWDTPGFTSTTQVWYDVTPASTPVTPTGTLLFAIYLPLVSTDNREYEFATYLDLTPATCHQATIGDLNDGDTVSFVALSSRVVNDRVVTEASDSIRVKMDVRP